jgi:hypothetical protein
MQLLAKVIFHLLNWVRGPVLVTLFFARFFFFLFLAIAFGCVLVLPQQRHVSVELLVLSLVGSLATYGIGQGYDRALYRLNVEAHR